MKRKKIIVSLLCAVLSLTLTFSAFVCNGPVRVEAATTGEIRMEINEVKAERQKIQEQMKALGEQTGENLTLIEQLVAEKNVIDQQIGLLNLDILLLNEQIQAYGLLIADKQDELDMAQAHLEGLVEQNKDRIRAMEEDGKLSYWSVLFRANDFSDLLDRLNMIEEIANADRRRLENMRIAYENVRIAREELNAEKAELEKSRIEMQEKQKELADKRLEADTKLVELNDQREEFLKLMEEAEKADNELMQQIAQLEKEYNEQKAKEDAAAAPPPMVGGKPPASVTNGITWLIPCNYIMVTSPYGYRINPFTGEPGNWHGGIDLGAYKNTPIVATRSGTVTIATYNYAAGYYVSINHGDGFSSAYMHMTHFVVSAGEQVSAGQVIGFVGSTGMSTGPHLHMSLSYDGVTVNPADYINFY